MMPESNCLRFRCTQDELSSSFQHSLFFAEEALSGVLIQWHLGAAKDCVWHPAHVFCNQRQCPSSTRVRFGASLVPKFVNPTGKLVNLSKIAVVLGSIGVPRCIPVVVGKQLVPQHTRVPRGQCLTLPV